MSSNSNDLREKICRIFGVFPEELEYNLPGGIGLEKVEAIEKLLADRENRARNNLVKEAKKHQKRVINVVVPEAGEYMSVAVSVLDHITALSPTKSDGGEDV